MKRYVALLLIVIMLSLSMNVYAQADSITVKVNNIVVNSPVPAQAVNGRTMLPMRSIFERVGATVTWMNNDKIIFATKGSLLITMQIGNNIMSVQEIGTDTVKKIELDSPPFIKDGSTFVPVRAVAESLGYKVSWDGETYTVNISTN